MRGGVIMPFPHPVPHLVTPKGVDMAERAPRRCQALCCELTSLSSLGLPSSLWGRGWKLRYSRSNFSEHRNWDLHVRALGKGAPGA